MRVFFFLFIILVLFDVATALAQENKGSTRKPVLIRSDRTSNRESEAEMISPDPIEAERNIRIGDFYFKRKNYKAAQERYRNALKYSPGRPGPYTKLIRVLERMEEFGEALEVCREFIKINPQAAKVNRFRSRVKKLEKKVTENPDP